MSESTATAPTQEDIDKLRSSLDQRNAQTAKERDELKTAMSRLQEEIAQLKGTAASDATLSTFQARLSQLDGIEDPAVAVQQAKAIAFEAARAAVTLNTIRAEIDGKNHRNQARAAALEIAHEHGGDASEFQDRLMKAQNEAQLEAEAKLIIAERLMEKAKEGSKEAPAKSEERAARQVDRGSGSAVRSNLIEEMNNIDVTTPEGRQKWAEHEKEFRRKINALSA